MSKRILVLTLLLLAPFSAKAVDGVIEINADCAVFGCFSGDSSGLPVTITSPGSYRLTSDLTTSSVNTTLIQVSTDSVAIDLNGFSLRGPVTCSGTTLTCSGSGSGDGIDANGREDIVIRNGAITGMGDDGIRVCRGARLENLTVAENGGRGIEALCPGVRLNDLVVRENGDNGVSLGFGASYVTDSTVFNNGGQGVFGGYCGNVLMSGNASNSCTAIAPNRCGTATQCD
ncbi:right-handed parallel beta-helix repeat-containing protein [Wenzhouxiangella sp. EGI_FJ10409]|uniref:right-handed parallel beta-helix repeat-containing protein n=1 Tax=Wenzhouxiangella sp. EGI_FJ10409 TaxID=3243767 RepID=UPI0035DD128C